jgi:hypothetical protein
MALSLSAQVVDAEQSAIGWIAAAIPALEFLVMVKIALAHAPGSLPPQGDRRTERGVIEPQPPAPISCFSLAR